MGSTKIRVSPEYTPFQLFATVLSISSKIKKKIPCNIARCKVPWAIGSGICISSPSILNRPVLVMSGHWQSLDLPEFGSIATWNQLHNNFWQNCLLFMEAINQEFMSHTRVAPPAVHCEKRWQIWQIVALLPTCKYFQIDKNHNLCILSI